MWTKTLSCFAGSFGPGDGFFQFLLVELAAEPGQSAGHRRRIRISLWSGVDGALDHCRCITFGWEYRPLVESKCLGWLWSTLLFFAVMVLGRYFWLEIDL